LGGVIGGFWCGGSLEILHPSLRQALERRHEVLDALFPLGGQGLRRRQLLSEPFVLGSHPL